MHNPYEFMMELEIDTFLFFDPQETYFNFCIFKPSLVYYSVVKSGQIDFTKFINK